MEPVEAATDSGARPAGGPGGAPDEPEQFPQNRVVGPARGAPSHARRHPGHPRRWRTVAAVLGTIAAGLAAVIGGVMSGRPPAAGPTEAAGHSDRVTAQHITVSQTPKTVLPLSDPQVAGLLTRRPDLGPLADARLRGSCLRGLGYPSAATVLGARSLELDGRPALLLLLPGEAPDSVAAFVVDENCTSTRTGLIAHTVVSRP